MNRRDFLKASAAAAMASAGGLAAPFVAKAAATKLLKFVPQTNVANLDPIWGTQYVVRNASLLIWDTLYGVDSKLDPQPQMAEGHEVTDDGRTWTFKLRAGLTFHDGEPVLSRDVIASLTRWMARDTMGQMINARLDALEALDDRTFRFRLNKPFTKMLLALGKSNPPVACIMPERIAKTDPFRTITEIVGSGPMKFPMSQWVAGSLAVFEKFDGYLPRPEASDWLAGGKRMMFDRIEWQIMPDAASASAALQKGEIDWWEQPIPDLVPLLRRNRNVIVDIADPLGNIGSLRMNHLHPPFDDVRARRALQLALSQEDYMQAAVGDDALWKPLPSFFTPGTPLYTEAGGDVLKGPRKYDEAKRLLAEAGYKGEAIVLLIGADLPIVKAHGDVTADLLGRIGMKVDYVATDWGTVSARRAKKEPPSQGGWHIFHSHRAGADCTNPASYRHLVTSGDGAWFGWPKSDEVMADIAEWYAAPDLAGEKLAVDKMNKDSMDFVTEIPTGFFLGYQAWRSNVTGVVKAPFPVFWGTQKS